MKKVISVLLATIVLCTLCLSAVGCPNEENKTNDSKEATTTVGGGSGFELED